MPIDICYFSGTGNSLAVARDIADRTGARLLSIPSAMAHETVTSGADAMGLVFPVYHKGIPLILKRFVEKMGDLGGKYLFAAYTYGDTPGLAARDLSRLVQSRGGRLAAGFGVHMPYNYVTPSPVLRGFFSSFKLRQIPAEQQRALFAASHGKTERIAALVSARQSVRLETTSDVLTRLADRLGLSETLGKWAWLKIAGVEEPTDVSFLESRQLMDQAFRADRQCTACGICATVCPVSNIEMVEDKPSWQHRCEQCFACLHWCPEEAVQFGGNTFGGKRYHHPDVTLADMVRAAPKD
ncbi:MAG: EFR1 family ferrodoxin [Anaerolineae bacterium]|jgi:ferredoxin/flavodoxin